MYSIARHIEHTNLHPNATFPDIAKLCREAKEHNFAGVCVSPTWVPSSWALLHETRQFVVTVIGFPHGNSTPEGKLNEADLAFQHGASEVDMVMNIGRFKDQDYQYVERDIKGVILEAAQNQRFGESRGVVKVILETGYLTEEEIGDATMLAVNCGADFVKTSTGFGPSGARLEDVAIMKKHLGTRTMIKAAGGIRDIDTAKAMLDAGAQRLGCSASVSIMGEEE